MLLQCRNQHFPRQRQESFLEAARQRYRPFDQRRDLIQQGAADQRAAAEFGRHRRDSFPDQFAAYFEVGKHKPALAQRRLIAPGGAEPNRLRRMKAMPPCQVARLRVQNIRGNDILAVQHDQPMHRPDKLGCAGSPVHATWNRQRLEGRPHDARQQLADRRATLATDVEEERALAFVEFLQRFQGRPATLCEGQRGAGGLTRGVERGAHRRAPALDVLIGLLRRQSFHEHGQSPRRRERQYASKGQPGALETAAHAGPECELQGAQRLGRQFLGAQLDQEIAPLDLHERAPVTLFAAPVPVPLPAATGVPSWRASIGNPSASRLAKYACATALANVLTRKM